MSAIYWAITTLRLLKMDSDGINMYSPMSIESIKTFLDQCEDLNEGGWGGDIGLDSHLLFTLSAIQIHKLLNLPIMNAAKHIKYIQSRLDPKDGSFTGDQWGETDTRFSYCAIAALSLLVGVENVSQHVDPSLIASYIWKCWNFDGGFGARPDCESHAGQIWCCLATLFILGISIPNDKRELMIRWLSWRQKEPDGGLNGRPEKLQDICYSWWVLASLKLLECLRVINKDALKKFIYSCQDEQNGGFSDRPEDMADIFHTLFAIAGLSLLNEEDEEDKKDVMLRVDPRFCLPISFVCNDK